jgi:hypothetical protein
MRIRSLALSLAILSVSVSTVFGQYKMDAAGDPVPSAVPAAIGTALQAPGVKVLNASGQVFCEVWLVKTAPNGTASTESDVTLPTIPVGGLIGAIQFPEKAADRRDQAIKPGLYLLRYVLMPVNGAHQGAAPQRDFAAMVPAASDPGLSAKPSLEEVIAMSTKVSQTSHPAILSLAPGSGKVTFTKEGDHDWTLNTKLGDTPVAIILVGRAEN